ERPHRRPRRDPHRTRGRRRPRRRTRLSPQRRPRGISRDARGLPPGRAPSRRNPVNDTSPIAVDVWSDIACPWCYIGKRKFEAGVARYREEHPDAPDVAVTYHSFELSPDTPGDFAGSTVEFLAERKGMGVEQVEQMLDRVTQIAADVGLDYDFD